MIKNIKEKLNQFINSTTNLFDRHDFSLLWANIIFCSSIALVVKDMPAIVRETLPYNGILYGIIGIIIALAKYGTIKYRNYYVHCVVDFLGAMWLIIMGSVTTTAVPPMMFTGVILFVTGIMINFRLIQRGNTHRQIKKIQQTKRR